MKYDDMNLEGFKLMERWLHWSASRADGDGPVDRSVEQLRGF